MVSAEFGTECCSFGWLGFKKTKLAHWWHHMWHYYFVPGWMRTTYSKYDNYTHEETCWLWRTRWWWGVFDPQGLRCVEMGAGCHRGFLLVSGHLWWWGMTSSQLLLCSCKLRLSQQEKVFVSEFGWPNRGFDAGAEQTLVLKIQSSTRWQPGWVSIQGLQHVDHGSRRLHPRKSCSSGSNDC